jgi:hypothetical protein
MHMMNIAATDHSFGEDRPQFASKSDQGGHTRKEFKLFIDSEKRQAPHLVMRRALPGGAMACERSEVHTWNGSSIS